MNNLKTKLVKNLISLGYIKTPKVKKSMLKISRELFVSEEYYDEAYSDTPLPISF